MGNDRLRVVGLNSWYLLGILALAGVVWYAFTWLSALTIPLVVAVVVGILFVPLVDRLGRWMHRYLAAGVVLLVALGFGAWIVYIAVEGVVEQAPLIAEELTAGFEAMVAWLQELGLGAFLDADELLGALEEALYGIIPGIGGAIGSAFSSLAALVVGLFVALFLLFFLLADWDLLTNFTGTHLGVPADLGLGIIEDTIWSMRKYFYVLTATSLVTAVMIAATMAILRLPLIAAVFVVTWMTSYIPYIGAFFSGAFAFLIALGSGGITDAMIVLAVILVAQNVVQPVVQAKMTEDQLNIHPVVAFGSTIVGAAVAGVLGATLSAPVVAMIVSINRRVREYETGAAPESGA
jgi:predicted PurR-regulated permease PerM